MSHRFAATREFLPIWRIFGLNADLTFRPDSNAIGFRRQVPSAYLTVRPDRNSIGSRRRAFRHVATVSFSARVRARPIFPLTAQRFDELDADFEPTQHFSAPPTLGGNFNSEPMESHQN
jgi:hypothetical protein